MEMTRKHSDYTQLAQTTAWNCSSIER